MPSILQGEVELESALSHLLPSQQEFIKSGERYVCLAGGVGSGKSVALCCAAILRGFQNPGGFSLVGRLNMPALKVTTRKTFLELFPIDWVADGGRGWRESDNRLTMFNGHEFLFSHLDVTDAEVKAHIRSLNLTAFYIDEATEVPEQVYLTLQGRLRRQNTKFHCGRLSTNPGGQDWLWRTFFCSTRTPKLKKMCRGIISPTQENIYLPEGYVDGLLWPADWAERFIYGSFADFTDKVYKDWDQNVHVWDSEVEWEVFGGKKEPPADWPVIVGMDIGGVDPWSLIFIAIQPETGFLFAYDEVYQSGILVRDIAERYWEKLQEHNLEGMAYDYENQQAALELAEIDVSGSPANKDVRSGIFKVGQYLHPDPRLLHPFTGGKGSPRLFISSRCRNLIRELPMYSWAKDRQGNPTGKPKDGEDHSCDALRYAIHTFRPEPRYIKDQPRWMNPKLDELSRMFWRDVEMQEKRQQKRKRTAHFSYSPVVIR